MTTKTVTLINGKTYCDVIIKRWVNDPNFYKISVNKKYQRPQDFLVNVNQILMIEDYIEIDISELPPVMSY